MFERERQSERERVRVFIDKQRSYSVLGQFIDDLKLVNLPPGEILTFILDYVSLPKTIFFYILPEIFYKLYYT